MAGGQEKRYVGKNGKEEIRKILIERETKDGEFSSSVFRPEDKVRITYSLRNN